jgi:hypothetical protein
MSSSKIREAPTSPSSAGRGVVTPEREAELRALAARWHGDFPSGWPTLLLEALDAMAAERERAERAEKALAGLMGDSGIDFDAELAHLRGEGPDPVRVRHLSEVAAWLSRCRNSGFGAARILVELQGWLERETKP